MEDVFFAFISEYFAGMSCCIRSCSEFGKSALVHSKRAKPKNYSVITCWHSGALLKHGGVFHDCNCNWCRSLASSSIAFEISSTSDSVTRRQGCHFYMGIFRYFWNHETLDYNGPLWDLLVGYNREPACCKLCCLFENIPDCAPSPQTDPATTTGN